MRHSRPSMLQRRERETAERAARIAAAAVSFTAHFRVGPFETYTLQASTLAEARALAAELTATHGRYGRSALVYAILPNGNSEPIPERALV